MADSPKVPSAEPHRVLILTLQRISQEESERLHDQVSAVLRLLCDETGSLITPVYALPSASITGNTVEYRCHGMFIILVWPRNRMDSAYAICQFLRITSDH